MTKEIQAFGIDSYRRGMRNLMYAAAPGITKVITKDGTVDVPFAAGDLLLSDEHGRVIVGPVSLVGAVDLAERILEGDQRAFTDPLALLTLATAIAGFRIENDPAEPEPVEPAAAVSVPGA
ncbi:hypothetical protein GGQ99_004740 [Aminobacter niigataensis]|uniref:Uncharacterized protein n=1 Tax=Aminobacter niigataensis TaxID=83265 RepID=A0ABR6L8K6_9HYPH|nr:hypothetical protein [Aminobacter niigataensis]MBB4652956.1 hypothetical protein [Aminobacter niigataensis]